MCTDKNAESGFEWELFLKWISMSTSTVFNPIFFLVTLAPDHIIHFKICYCVRLSKKSKYYKKNSLSKSCSFRLKYDFKSKQMLSPGACGGSHCVSK